MARKPSTPRKKADAAETTEPPMDQERAIIDAALALAADRSWSSLALADIAAAADLSLIDLYRRFPSKSAILKTFSRRIDAAMIEHPVEADAPARDRLFEVIMHRIDLLTPYKPGLAGLAREARHGRLDAMSLACQLPRSLGWMLETAAIPAGGLRGKVRVKLLGLAYLSTVRRWLKDDSPDLARTMAALDRALKRVEPFMALGRRPDPEMEAESAV